VCQLFSSVRKPTPRLGDVMPDQGTACNCRHVLRSAGYQNTANMRTECVCRPQASRCIKRNDFAEALRNGWCAGVKMTVLASLVFAKLPVDRLDGSWNGPTFSRTGQQQQVTIQTSPIVSNWHDMRTTVLKPRSDVRQPSCKEFDMRASSCQPSSSFHSQVNSGSRC